MISNSQAFSQQSCFHASYEVSLDGRIHFLHVITRTGDGMDEDKEIKLFFLADYYGWAVDSHEKIEKAKEILKIQ